MGNPGEYRKCGIRVSTGKVKIRASTENVESGRVPEMGDPGEYRKCMIRASTGEGWDPSKYQRR